MSDDPGLFVVGDGETDVLHVAIRDVALGVSRRDVSITFLVASAKMIPCGVIAGRPIDVTMVCRSLARTKLDSSNLDDIAQNN